MRSAEANIATARLPHLLFYTVIHTVSMAVHERELKETLCEHARETAETGVSFTALHITDTVFTALVFTDYTRLRYGKASALGPRGYASYLKGLALRAAKCPPGW